MFKKLFLLTLATAMFTTGVNGQNVYIKRTKYKHIPQAEIRVSHGLLPLTYDNFELFGIRYDMRFPSVTYQYNQLQQYRGNLYSTGALSVSHSVKLSKFIEMGAVFTYVGNFRNYYSASTNEMLKRESSTNLFFTPTIRFAWFSRDWIKMYSSVGFGVGVAIDKLNYMSGSSIVSEPDIKWGPSIQLTGFGISLGRKFFWFTELQAIGTLGIFTTGVGYRVVPQQRR